MGASGPMAAAAWCTYREGGWPGVKSWLRHGFTQKVGWTWWVFILCIPFLIPPLALGCFRLMGGVVAVLPVASQPWIILPTVLLMTTIGGGQEEYGWRGYLLPVLAEEWRSWQVDAFMIGVHVCWHLPLFFIG
jgi:membrane protease YdiL (CAAX protease family)